jgi:hypothetical protein
MAPSMHLTIIVYASIVVLHVSSSEDVPVGECSPAPTVE